MIPTPPPDEPAPPPAPRFVAYVYPGWHRSDYRPGLDEWTLLDAFTPRFRDHSTPPRPAGGQYDDAAPETARRHRDTALAFGIEGFTYFAYFQPEVGFVMADPMYRLIDLMTETVAPFSVGTTWCIRLPHDKFPVAAGDELDLRSPATRPDLPLADRPIESLSIADIEDLLGPDDQVWERTLVESGFMSAAARRRRRPAGSPDSTPYRGGHDGQQ